MGFLDKLRSLLIEDVDDTEMDDDVKVEEVIEDVKVNVDPIESIVEEMQDEEVADEPKVEEVVEKVVVKEEKMHTIDLAANHRKEEVKAKRERMIREDAASFILHPVVSPMYGKKGEDIKVEPKAKVEVKTKTKKDDPLTTVISPFYGKCMNENKEETKTVMEQVAFEETNVEEETSENKEFNYVEASQEMVIPLQDLLGDDQNDNTVQISLFNDDNFTNQDKE